MRLTKYMRKFKRVVVCFSFIQLDWIHFSLEDLSR